jgi:adenylate cyclase
VTVSALLSIFRPFALLLQHYRRYVNVFGPLTLGLIVTLFMLLILGNQPFLQQAELTTYDWQFQIRGQQPTPSNIVVVGVDASSVADLGGRYPPPRRSVGSAIRFLEKAGASVIGLDFEYINPSTYGRADDVAFEKALRGTHNVVLPQQLQGSTASNYVSNVTSLTTPIDPLPRLAARLGLSTYYPDADGAIRAGQLLFAGPGGSASGRFVRNPYPSFALEVASLYLHRSVSQILKTMPNSMLLNFIGPQQTFSNDVQSWNTVQFSPVARAEDAPNLFKGKIALIIPAAIDFKDVLNTPFGQMYGGYVQATSLNTILQHDPIQSASDLVNNLNLVIIGLVTTLAASRLGIWKGTLATLIVGAAYVGLAIVLFRFYGVMVNLITPETTLVLAYTSIMAFRFATEERLKRKTNKAFGLYLRPEVVDILVESEDPTSALQPTRRDISVLFVDIRGFTAMSEHMNPEDVVGTLDVYLEELTDAVQQTGGTLNKYVGDEIMAMWNTPLEQPDHAIRAVKCAMDMTARVDHINDQLRAKGQPSVAFGIGVNSGEAVVGQMGSTFRKQFDIIGDTVNTAARLCSAAGRMETIVGQGTWEVLGDRLTVEETEPLRLKGKSDTIRTFLVLGLAETPAPAPQLEPSAAPA